MTYRCANVVSMLFSIQFRLETGVRGMYKVEGFYFIHLWKGSYACYYNTTGVVYLQPCNITLSSIHTSRSIVMDVITHYNTSTLHISGGIQFVIKYSNICDERTSLRLAGRQFCWSLPIQAPDLETVPWIFLVLFPDLCLSSPSSISGPRSTSTGLFGRFDCDGPGESELELSSWKV